MRRILYFITLIFYCIPTQAQDFDTKKMRYIEQFKYWAMDEQIRTGVPASISLAQGILETGSGTSELCTQANNHFGIKCKKEWTGETFLHDDDRRNECFRKYKSAKDSYIDHSNFLRDRAHYRFLFDLEPTDYQAWCKGLRKAGYATNPKYAVRLIQLIEKYNLQQYTYEAIALSKIDQVEAEVVPKKDQVIEEPEEIPVQNEVVEVVKVAPKTTEMRRKVKRVYDKVMVKNGRSGFWAHKGDYLLPEAVQYNIRYAKLLAINDLEDEPLYEDMFIYLKKKARKGDRMFHRVKEGETMHSISQNVGVQLKYLYIYNNLYEGEEPAVNEKIYLQARSSKTPRLRGDEVITASKLKNKKAVKKERIEEAVKEVLTAKKEVEKPVTVEVETPMPLKVSKQDEPVARAKKAVVAVETQKERPSTSTKENVIARPISKKTDELQGITKKAQQEKVLVKEQRPNAVRTSVTSTKGESPILNLEKARRVEELMGDGSKEIDALFKLNERTARQEKVIASPQSNNNQIAKEKARRTKEKKMNSKRQYDDKNVSDDVKDLKKKFDSLIYED